MSEALSQVLGILVYPRLSFVVGITNYLIRIADPIGAFVLRVGFTPTYPIKPYGRARRWCFTIKLTKHIC